jgi:hypothetical protein
MVTFKMLFSKICQEKLMEIMIQSLGGDTIEIQTRQNFNKCLWCANSLLS